LVAVKIIGLTRLPKLPVCPRAERLADKQQCRNVVSASRQNRGLRRDALMYGEYQTQVLTKKLGKPL